MVATIITSAAALATTAVLVAITAAVNCGMAAQPTRIAHAAVATVSPVTAAAVSAMAVPSDKPAKKTLYKVAPDWAIANVP